MRVKRLPTGFLYFLDNLDSMHYHCSYLFFLLIKTLRFM
jgi:hypothetical protein